MPSTLSRVLIDTLQPLFSGLRLALEQNPMYLSAFLPLLHPEDMPERYDPSTRGLGTFSEADMLSLLTRLRNVFPDVAVSTLSKWCYSKAIYYMFDLPRFFELHGRLATALSMRQTDHNRYRLRFVITVVILHFLGHAILGSVERGYTQMKTSNDFPYHNCLSQSLQRMIPEPGYLVEEALFGGIIGIVFREERDDGRPPRFLQSDFTRIDYLFLHCRNGSTYELDPADLHDRITNWRLTRFDTSSLRQISLPRRIRERTCAFYNGDHLAVKFPGDGGELPPKGV
ncbi:unnamed protein product [Somion occarium]|uniref:Uncharacterized protein n=1 Tax=Somion occarium TaxID=3059160 RepID=A0ABP1CTN0_9APHY